MSSLFAALSSSAGALSAYQTVLDAVQNNVTNASTPGYARQSVSLEARPFQPSLGLPGGVSAGDLQSARDEFAEQNVRQQFSSLGTLEQKAQSLSDLELNFNVSSDSGIPGALNTLFQNFSSWSVTPDSSASRQAVVDSARQVALSFQQTSANVAKAFNGTGQQLQQTVSQINRLAAQLQHRQHAAAQGQYAGRRPGCPDALDPRATVGIRQTSPRSRRRTARSPCCWVARRRW